MKRLALPAAAAVITVASVSFYLTSRDANPRPNPDTPQIVQEPIAPGEVAETRTGVGPSGQPAAEAILPAETSTNPFAAKQRLLLTALKSGNSDAKEKALAEVLPLLLQQDIVGTAKLVAALESWAWREELLQRVARSWATQDSGAATEWANQLPEPERAPALRNICIELAQTNPAQALAIAEQNTLTATQDPVVESLVQLWATRDFAAAEQWAARQPVGDSRDKAYARIALAQTATAPAEAAQLVADRIAPGPIQTEAAISVLHQWAQRDHTSAKAWVAQFPQGDFRKRAEGELEGIERYLSTAK